MNSLMSCSSLAGVWMRLRALWKTTPSMSPTSTQRCQCSAVMGFQFRARPVQQRLPAVHGGNDAHTAEHLVLLIGHLREQQVRELFQIIAIGEAIVTQHIAEVPQLLHHRLRVLRGHRQTLTATDQTRHQCRTEAAPDQHREGAASVRARSRHQTRCGARDTFPPNLDPIHAAVCPVSCRDSMPRRSLQSLRWLGEDSPRRAFGLSIGPKFVGMAFWGR